ncbi:hypothetical protein LMC10_04595 [Limosilactobacillus reuteri]|uniref:hypothetical protein n=1 Tax=Limosilactobacillus reuteri TaxID=1598 RepID=UPI001E397C49|nr:hypothetical protein [Limosilactobacillus reuteri]MCC4399368.1 hypothetical protein [Limosilactobacillus reuteri]MCC4403374.1 hypothetical protein [Limosilactobacillus reuteri]
MDNYTIVSIFILVTLFIGKYIFDKNRGKLLGSLFDLLRAILRLFTIPVFQIIIFYEGVIITIITFCCFEFHNPDKFKDLYSYVSFVALVIIPESVKIDFNTKIQQLITVKILEKFTLVSFFTFIMKAFEPNLLVSFFIVLFFIFQTFVQVITHNDEAFPFIMKFLSFTLFGYAIYQLLTKFSCSLVQKLIISFTLPIIFWIINIPLLFLLRYLMELDRSINWIESKHKLLLILKILIIRFYLMFRLHKQILKANFDIDDVKLGGLGHKVYTVTTGRKLNKREQQLVINGYKYLILDTKSYKGVHMTFPIAVNLVYKNNKYCNWHYKNIDPAFMDLVR